MARIECHYFVHAGFFEHDGALLEGADRIAHLPCEIVQGRYDVVCPAESAWTLHRRLPKSRMHIVDGAGHSALEDGIIERLVAATDGFR
jgi:proline iminopeptidase